MIVDAAGTNFVQSPLDPAAVPTGIELVALAGVVSHKFAGVSRRLHTPDARRRRPCATSTLTVAVEPQIASIHPANADRIYDSRHRGIAVVARGITSGAET